MTFRPIHKKGHLYFVTGSIIRWRPIFKFEDYRNIVINSLNWHISNKRMKVFAFVVMSNHLHWISYPIPPYSIIGNIWSFSSYTAHEILRATRSNGDQDFIRVFSKYAERRKLHKIWKDFQAKNIHSQGFLMQKLEYIHNNPIREYILVSRAEYPFSSARYYDDGKNPVIQIEDLFEYINLL